MAVAIRGNKLYGYGESTNCKITEFHPKDDIHYSCIFSFGKGKNEFCMTASFDIKHPDDIYIARVENTQTCLLGKTLNTVEQGTAKLVRIGLHAMRIMMPKVKRFTLKDDSHIYCNGKSGPKMSFAYETISKYNQTWYQQKFGAVLPGFLSQSTVSREEKDEIMVSLNGQPTYFRVVPNSLMSIYLHSLAILDMPCEPYQTIIKKLPFLSAYPSQYESSATPREFITALRLYYGKKYCDEIFRWYPSYMEYLRIEVYHDAWYIPVERIREPEGFRAEIIRNAGVMNTLGGTRRARRQTTRKQDKRWGIMPFCYERDSGKGFQWADSDAFF